MFPDDTLPSLRQTGYDIYVRAGLVEYLLERPERSRGILREGHAAPARAELRRVVSGHIPTGIERLIEAAKSGKSLTPEIVRKGDQKANLILMLADVYHEGQQHAKSLDLCTRVIDGVAPKATREQKSYAYFRRGRNHYLIQGMESFNPDAALKDYVTAVTIAPKAPWADKAMFLAANIFWNHKHNLDAAVSVWRRLIREYPKSKDADRSAFFIGTAFFFSKQYPEAEKALGQYIAKYPDSQFLADAKTLLDQCNAATR